MEGDDGGAGQEEEVGLGGCHVLVGRGWLYFDVRGTEGWGYFVEGVGGKHQ